MTKTETKDKNLNNAKNSAYSSYYSIISFLASVTYLIADIFVDGYWAANIAVSLLIVLILACGIGIKTLRTGLEANNPKAQKWQEKLSKIAVEVSYLSYPLLVVTLLFAIVASLLSVQN